MLVMYSNVVMRFNACLMVIFSEFSLQNTISYYKEKFIGAAW